MILADILDYLQQRETASLGEIAHHVSAEPATVRDMLVTLQRKGKVHRATAGGGCGSTCQQCAAGTLELDAWGPGTASPELTPPCGAPPDA